MWPAYCQVGSGCAGIRRGILRNALVLSHDAPHAGRNRPRLRRNRSEVEGQPVINTAELVEALPG